MIEVFKAWISSLLCIGIFTTFVQLVIPKTKLKKYIYSLIGVITIITIVSPVMKLAKSENFEEATDQVLANIEEGSTKSTKKMQEKYKVAKEEAVKEGFIEAIKKDITEKLVASKVRVKEVKIFLSKEYDIEQVEVNIEKLDGVNATMDSVNKVTKYINEEYDIDFSKIIVVEEGE